MRGRPVSAPLPPLTPDEAWVRARLAEHVRALAGEIGERNMWRPEALEASARYISATFRDLQYDVTTQSFRVWRRSVCNIAAEVRGRSSPDAIIVVGAHYDTVLGCPGANDNATGIAAMLEVARLVQQAHPADGQKRGVR